MKTSQVMKNWKSSQRVDKNHLSLMIYLVQFAYVFSLNLWRCSVATASVRTVCNTTGEWKKIKNAQSVVKSSTILNLRLILFWRVWVKDTNKEGSLIHQKDTEMSHQSHTRWRHFYLLTGLNCIKFFVAPKTMIEGCM